MKLFVVVFILVPCIYYYADSWRPPEVTTVETKNFDHIKIVTSRIGSKDQEYTPNMFENTFLDIYRKYDEKEVHVYRGISSHIEIYSSEKVKDYMQYFLGVSNTGLAKAIIVFDQSGNVIVDINHNATSQSPFNYCRESSTLSKQWFDYKNPEVNFLFKDIEEKSKNGKMTRKSKVLRDIEINSCDGKRLSIKKIMDKYFEERKSMPIAGVHLRKII